MIPSPPSISAYVNQTLVIKLIQGKKETIMTIRNDENSIREFIKFICNEMDEDHILDVETIEKMNTIVFKLDQMDEYIGIEEVEEEEETESFTNSTFTKHICSKKMDELVSLIKRG